MKQNIKLLSEACCDRLLRFQTDKEIKKLYSLDNFPLENLETINFITNYYIDDDLEISPKPEDDVNSSIAIFTQLKNLDLVQGNDRRLWVALTHGRFYIYTKERWKKSVGSSDKEILRRFHFEGASLEARMRNSISRLWWASRITYDENRDDPFELTRLLWMKQDLIQNLVERMYGTYDNVVKGVLEMYKNNKQLSEDELRALYTGLNAIGGVKVLPILSKEEVQIELRRIAEFKGIDLN